MSRHSESLHDLLASPPMPAIVAAAEEHEGAVLCVGGAVRDALLRRPSADIDLAVEGDLGAFIDVFARHCGRRPGAIGDRWRDTHRARVDDRQVDIGRMLGSRAEDLSQRDFTVNAMALNLAMPIAADPELIDLHGGCGDLKRRTIRMLSAEAMLSDPLRMLRAVRYTATLEGFRIDAETEAVIAAQGSALEEVAAERVQAEWAQLLAGAQWTKAVERCLDLGLDEVALGARLSLSDGLAWRAIEEDRNEPTGSANELVTLRLASLVAAGAARGADAVQEQLTERRWPLAIARRASRVGCWARRLDRTEVPELVEWALTDHAAAAAAAFMARAFDAGGGARASIAALEEFAGRAREERWVRGADLRAWGMGPGPEIGELLRGAARGQVAGRWNSADEAQAWARRQAGGRGASHDG